MPIKSWFANYDIEFEDSNGIAINGIIRLKRQNASGYWSPTASFPSETIFKLSNFSANAIKELFGFVPGQLENDGTIGYQLSSDNGTTWYRWDGAVWVDDGDFSTALEIDEGLPDFELDPADKQIKVRIKLEPDSTLEKTPAITSVNLYHELDYNYIEDFLRSIKRYIEDDLYILDYQSFNLECSTDTIILNLPFSPENDYIKLIEPIEVYNLDNDPGKTTNLYDRIEDKQIMLTSPQTGLIEIKFYYQPPVFITADEFLNSSTNPAIVIFLEEVFQDRLVQANNHVVEVSPSRKLARIRENPVVERFILTIICQDYSKRRVLSISEGIDRLFERSYSIISEANGRDFIVIEFPEKVFIDDTENNLKSIEMLTELSGRRWLELKGGSYKEYNLTETINVNVYNEQGNISGTITVSE